MNNAVANEQLEECRAELEQVELIIRGLGLTSNVVPYLTKFAVMRSCGAVELTFKAIIADCCSQGGSPQVKRFIDRRIRNGSANPNLDNIKRMLVDFDDSWPRHFQDRLNARADKTKLVMSLQSLVDARNSFAHGGSPSITIHDILGYFVDAREIIEILDSVVV